MDEATTLVKPILEQPHFPPGALQTHLTAAISLPANFKIEEVSTFLTPKVASSQPPTLGPLAAFVGNWTGSGFNTIFRPDNSKTPTVLPVAVPAIDNVLELNLTSETLSFSSSLGAVPNRGEVQGDIFLNGVPYLQSISDVTIPGQSTGIHLEPGLWVIVPPTTDPNEGQTLVRMASIPHGATVHAQGTSRVINGAPTIPAVNITPFGTNGGGPFTFASQTAANKETRRIPQDLTNWIAAGTITQAILDDPNTVLRNHLNGQNITSTTEIKISTAPAAPLFGSGTGNIAFLLGNPAATAPNAQSVSMTATFWIETVEHVILVPIFKPGQTPLTIEGTAGKVPGQPVPKFIVDPPREITNPIHITVHSTQIQYTQTVMLNFNTLTWPHVSVATLVPSAAITVPPSAWP